MDCPYCKFPTTWAPRARFSDGKVYHRATGPSATPLIICGDQARATDAEIADKIRDEKHRY